MSTAVGNPVPGAIASPTVRSPRAAVASWLGALFALLLLVIAVGGYVRLSGSGLSIPDWPLIRVGERWTLLPPTSEADWLAVRERYDADQQALIEKARRGAVGLGSLGAYAHDLPTFQRMFLVEWSHRLVAALFGMVAVACLLVVLRDGTLRRRVGVLFGTTCGLVVAQALIGGVLVKSGTSTHWLFVHLGNAALILSLITLTILRLLSPEAPLADDLRRRRTPLRRTLTAAVALVWVQIVLGALVAGSRSSGYDNTHFVTTWPLMHDRVVPHHLWDSFRPVAWNLLDNALLHQWVHRWFAWLPVGAVLVALWLSRRADPGPRLRLALRAAATFIAAQVVLGLANVFLAHPVLVALAHLVLAMFVLVTVVMARFDAAHEDAAQPAPAPGPVAQGVPA